MISVIAKYNGTTRIETHPLNGMSNSILRNNKLPLDQRGLYSIPSLVDDSLRT
jgi:hypothetical protein